MALWLTQSYKSCVARYSRATRRGLKYSLQIPVQMKAFRGMAFQSVYLPAIRSVINCKYGPAIGDRGKDRINGTRMTLMTRIIADKTPKDQCQSAESASSAFYESVH